MASDKDNNTIEIKYELTDLSNNTSIYKSHILKLNNMYREIAEDGFFSRFFNVGIPRGKKILITIWIYLPCGKCCAVSKKDKSPTNKRRIIKRQAIFDDSQGYYKNKDNRDYFGRWAFEWSEVHGTEYDKDLGCFKTGCPQPYKPDIRIE